jgi:hypothetical protein
LSITVDELARVALEFLNSDARYSDPRPLMAAIEKVISPYEQGYEWASRMRKRYDNPYDLGEKDKRDEWYRGYDVAVKERDKDGGD